MKIGKIWLACVGLVACSSGDHAEVQAERSFDAGGADVAPANQGGGVAVVDGDAEAIAPSGGLADAAAPAVVDAPAAAPEVSLTIADAPAGADLPDAPPPPASLSDASPTSEAPAPASFACTGLPRPRQPYQLVDAFAKLPDFSVPTAALQAPGQPERWYVAEQGGRLVRFDNRADVGAVTVSLDLSARIEAQKDAGLLGVAFHPGFAQNGEVFLSYTVRGNPMQSRLSRFVSHDGGASFDLASEQILIEIPQPDLEMSHVNGDIHFGADGYLWVAFGDGAFGNDTRNEAQNPNTLNGKILRIDVNHRGPAGEPYAIPPDNPFVGKANARGEVWALGFRNPWRWRFDPSAPDVIWVGDVGGDKREEIDRVVKGGNYGWNPLEGSLCATQPCSPAGLLPPVVEYPHEEGKCVIGGPVYRGQRIPALRDRYVYADFFYGQVWALPPDAGRLSAPQPELLLETGLQISSFGEALDGELWLLEHETGRLYQLVATAAGPEIFPATLAQTGCFTPAGQPSAGLEPYDVNAALWSDGASKRRWMMLPAGAKIAIGNDGDFDFPANTTLVKEFSLGETRVETRLFVRHADGGWAGYSYAWNPEQTEAALLPATSVPVRKTFGAATWSYPTRGQCMFCHTPQAGFSLGPEVAQLNRWFTYPDGSTANQLVHMQKAGLLAAPLPGEPSALPALSPPGGTAALDLRARSYLHANCSGCHRPGTRGSPDFDLRFSTGLANTRLCNVNAEWGDFDGAELRLSPGQPDKSVMARAMRATTSPRMPIIGPTLVDAAGVALIESWIGSLTGCQ